MSWPEIAYSVLCISLFVVHLPGTGGIAVMSVDLGSEWLKIGIVKPGVPMEIALNVESKRKTPFVVSMKGHERLFSEPALNVASKQPAKAFVYLSHIIGKKFNSPEVELYRKRFPFFKLLKDEDRGTVLFEGDGEVNYSVEELVAMVLNNSKHIAEKFASQKMKDVVITVPAFFTQSQRRSLILAANMTGLNVLQLMNDNAAVALNYGIFRSASFNSSVRHIMFYDMGASHTTVTIVGYSTTKIKDRGYAETVPQLVIKGVGFDAALGGLEMDLRLRDHLLQGFRKKYSNIESDITKNPKAMAKLLKEARRVRQVLSPNTEHYAQIENLFEEKDFRMKVTRSEFEELCRDLFERVTKPVKMAFDAASMTDDDIESVILMGGGSRIPRVQDMLAKSVGARELGKSINTDEAAALGAVYKAASLMVGFKVKRFIVKDINMYPVDVQFERTSTSGSEHRQINRNLYHRLNPLPQKKIMTFNKKLTDFNFNISYGDLSSLPEVFRQTFIDNIQFAHVQLIGVEKAHTKNVNGNPKGVKAFYHLDESGILSIDKVEAHFEKTPEIIKEEESTLSKIGSKISDFFGGLKKEEPELKQAEEIHDIKGSGEKGPANKELKGEKKVENEAGAENAEKVNAGKIGNNTTSSNDSIRLNATEKSKHPENITVIETIQFEIVHTDIPKMSSEKFDKSVSKLNALEARDQLRKAMEMARNNLESFISEGRENLDQEQVQRLSSVEERRKIVKDFTEVHNWFDEDGYDADEGTLKKKLKFLKESTKELNLRMIEAKERPKAIAGMLQSLNLSTIFSESMLSMPDSSEIYTEKDHKDLAKILTDTKSWFVGTWKKQNETSPERNPVLLVKDIHHHQGKLDREIMYLINKAKYYIPKPKSKNETISNSTKSKKSQLNSPTPANKTYEGSAAEDEKIKKPDHENNEEAAGTEQKADFVNTNRQTSNSSREKQLDKDTGTESTSTEANREPFRDTVNAGSTSNKDGEKVSIENIEIEYKHTPEDEL